MNPFPSELSEPTVLGRLDPNDSIAKVLETAKLALESDSDIWTD
ncbi:MAG: hypothetical protein WCF23_20005 [Candidatus Nitrosopolaris sp.]